MIIDELKLSLRISSTAFDSEIEWLIAQAKADLKLCGVLEAKIIDSDELIKRAIITFCKANFGLSNADSEKFQSSYESIRNHLSMSVEYNGGDADV